MNRKRKDDDDESDDDEDEKPKKLPIIQEQPKSTAKKRDDDDDDDNDADEDEKSKKLTIQEPPKSPAKKRGDDDDDDDEDETPKKPTAKEAAKFAAKKRDDDDDDDDDDEDEKSKKPTAKDEPKPAAKKRKDDDDDDDDDDEDEKPKKPIAKDEPKSAAKKRDEDDDDDDDDETLKTVLNPPQKPTGKVQPKIAGKVQQKSARKVHSKTTGKVQSKTARKVQPKTATKRRIDDDDDDEDDDDDDEVDKIPKQCQTDITLDPEGYPPNMEEDIQTIVTIGTKDCSDSKIKEQLRKPYVHEEVLSGEESKEEKKIKDQDEGGWEEEVEERKLIPLSVLDTGKDSLVSNEESRISRYFNEPEFRSAIKPKDIVHVTDADIQRRINRCDTYNEKQLLNGVSDTMKTLMMEINNLRNLYDKVCKEQDANDTMANMDEQSHDTKTNENLEDTIEQISELDKYEFDLLSHVADEFPLAVVITDSPVLESDDEMKFDLPARNIKDFDNLYMMDGQEIEANRPMLDTDLLQPPAPLDHNIFTIGSKLPVEMDPHAVKPMWDSNLKSGIIPPQVGLTKRRDRTIFLEDYIQYVMEDKDLLVKPCNDDEPKEKPELKEPELKINQIQYKLQYDTDLGRPPPKLRKDVEEKLLKCKCKIGQEMGECVCGCPQNRNICEMNSMMMTDSDENLSDVSVESDVTFPRGMFDYDLYGKFIRKRRKKCLDDSVMWDYNLCPSASRYHLAYRVDNRHSTDSFENNFNEYEIQRGMFDYDLMDKTKIDPKVYLNRRAMFDFDLGEASDDSETHDLEFDNLPMMDYNLKGNVIKKQFGQMSPLYIKRVRNRAMFDVDLKRATAKDSKLSLSEASSDSITNVMTECDIGKKFVPVRKKGGKKLQKQIESSSKEDGYTRSNNAMPIPWNHVAIKDNDGRRKPIPRYSRKESTDQSYTPDNDTYSTVRDSSTQGRYTTDDLQQTSGDEDDLYGNDTDDQQDLEDGNEGRTDTDEEDQKEPYDTRNEFVEALSLIEDVEDPNSGMEKDLCVDEDLSRSEDVMKKEVDYTPSSSKLWPLDGDQSNEDVESFKTSIQYENSRDNMHLHSMATVTPQRKIVEGNLQTLKSGKVKKHLRSAATETPQYENIDENTQTLKNDKKHINSNLTPLSSELWAVVNDEESNEDLGSYRMPIQYENANSHLRTAVTDPPQPESVNDNVKTLLYEQNQNKKFAVLIHSIENEAAQSFIHASIENTDSIQPRKVDQELSSERENVVAAMSHRSSAEVQHNKKSPRNSKNSGSINLNLISKDTENKRESKDATDTKLLVQDISIKHEFYAGIVYDSFSRRLSDKTRISLSDKKSPRTSKDAGIMDPKLVTQGASSKRGSADIGLSRRSSTRSQVDKTSPRTSKDSEGIDPKLLAQDMSIKRELHADIVNSLTRRLSDKVQEDKKSPRTSNDVGIMDTKLIAQDALSKRGSADAGSSRRSSTKTQADKTTPRTSKDSEGIDPKLLAQDISIKRELHEGIVNSFTRRLSDKSQADKKSPRTSKNAGVMNPKLITQDELSNLRSVSVPSSRKSSTNTQADKKSPRTSQDVFDNIDPKLLAQNVPNNKLGSEESSSRKRSIKELNNNQHLASQDESFKVESEDGQSSMQASVKGPDPEFEAVEVSDKGENVISPPSRKSSTEDQPNLPRDNDTRDQLEPHICNAMKKSDKNESIKPTISSTISYTESTAVKILPTVERTVCECDKSHPGKTSFTSVKNENVDSSNSLPKVIEEKSPLSKISEPTGKVLPITADKPSLCECEKQLVSESIPIRQIDSDDKWLGAYVVPCVANKIIFPTETLDETLKKQNSLSICECSEIKIVKPPDRRPCKACEYAAQMRTSNSDEISEESYEKPNEIILGKISPDTSKADTVAMKPSGCICEPQQATNSSDVQPILKIILPYTDGTKQNILEIGIRQTNIEFLISNTSVEQRNWSNERQTGGENVNKNNTLTNNNDNWSSEIVQNSHNSEDNTQERNLQDKHSSKPEDNEFADGWSVTACREHFGEPSSHGSIAFILQQELYDPPGPYDCKKTFGDDKISKHIQQIEKIIKKYTDLSGLKFEAMYDKEKMRKIFRRWFNGTDSSSLDSSLSRSRSEVHSECRQFIKDTKAKSEIVAMLDYEVLSDTPDNNDSFIQYENELRQLEYFSNQDDDSDVIENPNKNTCKSLKSSANSLESRKNQLDYAYNSNLSNDLCECCLKPVNVSKSKVNVCNSKVHNSVCNASMGNNSVCNPNTWNYSEYNPNNLRSRTNVSERKTIPIVTKSSRKVCCCSKYNSPSCDELLPPFTRDSEATIPSTKLIIESHSQDQCVIIKHSNSDVVSNLSSSPTMSAQNLSFTDTINDSNFRIPWACDYSHIELDCTDKLPDKISNETILFQSIDSLEEKVSEFKVSCGSDYSHFSREKECASVQNVTRHSEDLMNVKHSEKPKQNRWEISTHRLVISGMKITDKMPSCPTLSFDNGKNYDSFDYPHKQTWSEDYSHYTSESDCVSEQEKTQLSEPLINFQILAKQTQVCPDIEPSNHMIQFSGMNLRGKSEVELVNICPSVTALKVFYSCSSIPYNIPYDTDWCLKILENQKSGAGSVYQSCEKVDQLIGEQSSIDDYSVDNCFDYPLTKSTEPSACLCGICKLSGCKCTTVKVNSSTKLIQEYCECKICKCESMNLRSNKSKVSRQSCTSGVTALVETEIVSRQLETCPKLVSKAQETKMTKLTDITICKEILKSDTCNCDIVVNQQPRSKLTHSLSDPQICSQWPVAKLTENTINQKHCECGFCHFVDCSCEFASKQSRPKSVVSSTHRQRGGTLPPGSKSTDNIICQQSCKCGICHLVDCKCENANHQSYAKSDLSSADQKNGNFNSAKQSIDTSICQESCKCGFCNSAKCKCDTVNQQSCTKTDRQSTNVQINQRSANVICQKRCKCERCQLVDCKCEGVDKKIRTHSVTKPNYTCIHQQNCKCEVCIKKSCECKTTKLELKTKYSSLKCLKARAIYLLQKSNENSICKNEITEVSLTKSKNNQSLISKCAVKDCWKDETVKPCKTTSSKDNQNQDYKCGCSTRANGNENHRFKCGFCNDSGCCKCKTTKPCSTRSKDNKNKSNKCGFCNDEDCKCEISKPCSPTRSKGNKNQDYKCEFCNDVDCKCEISKPCSPTRSKGIKNQRYKCDFCNEDDCKCEIFRPCPTIRSTDNKNQSYKCEFCNDDDCKCEISRPCPIKRPKGHTNQGNKCEFCNDDDCKCETKNLQSGSLKSDDDFFSALEEQLTGTKTAKVESDQEICICLDCHCETLIPDSAIKSNDKSPLDDEVCICSVCKCETLIPDSSTKANDKPPSDDEVCKCQVCECEIVNQSRLKSGKLNLQTCTCIVCHCEKLIPRSDDKSNDKVFSPLLIPLDCTCGRCLCEKINLQGKKSENIEASPILKAKAEQSCKCGFCNQVDCKCETTKLSSVSKSNDSPVSKCETVKPYTENKSNVNRVCQQSSICRICKSAHCKCEIIKLRSATKSKDSICQQSCKCGFCQLDDCKCQTENVKLIDRDKRQNNCTCRVCECGKTKPLSTSKLGKISICQKICDCGVCEIIDCICQSDNVSSTSNYFENRVRSVCDKFSGMKVDASNSELIICCEEINSSLPAQKTHTSNNLKIEKPCICIPCSSVLKPLKSASVECNSKSKSEIVNDCLFTKVCPAKIFSKPNLTMKQICSEPKICPSNICSSKYTKHEDINKISITYQRKSSFCKCVTESESVLQISNYPSSHSRRSVKSTKIGIKSTRSVRSKKRKRSKHEKRQKSHESKKSSERNLSSTTASTASQTERKSLRENVVTKAIISCENEIRPLKEALFSLQTKIKNLNFIDMGVGNLSASNILSSPKYSSAAMSRYPNLYQSPTKPIRECYCPENPFGLQNFNYPTTSRNIPTHCVNKNCECFASKLFQQNVPGTSKDVNNVAPVKKRQKKSPIRRHTQINAATVPNLSTMQPMKPLNQDDLRKRKLQNLANLKIEPENFLLGSTPLRTDPDMLFAWKKPPNRFDK